MTDEDLLLITPEERLALRRRRLLLIVLSAVLLAALLAFFLAHPAAATIRGWQARRHAQKAFGFINKEQWQDAQAEAVAAYQLKRDDKQALRAVARLLSRTNQMEALDFWKQLDDQQALTTEDRRDEARIAIVGGDNNRAETRVRELVGSKDAGPADWLLAAQLAMQKNLLDQARPYLERVISDSKTTEAQQLQASLFQLALAGDVPRRADAAARIKRIAQGKSATALEALVILAKAGLAVPVDSEFASAGAPRQGSASPTPVQEGSAVQEPSPSPPPIVGKDEIVGVARAIENHPLAQAHHKMLALDLLLHADPSQHDAIVARAIQNWKDADAPDLASLASWLNSKGEFQKTLDTIQLSRAGQSRDLFVQYLEALAALGRWSDAKELLTSDKFPLDPTLQYMYLAHCSGQLREETAAANNWQRALESAGGNVQKLITLAHYAERAGNAKVAQAAYNSAAAVSPKSRMAQDGRVRLAWASRDTKKVHAVLAEMLVLWPNDPAIQNDEAYTRLLLLSAADENTKQQSAAIEQLANNLIEREPASMPHRTLLALARLRQGRNDDALSVYSRLQLTPDALTGSALAVHAAVLAATAHIEDAKTEAAQIKRDGILPEEDNLIKGIAEAH
jgi:tetratricopeptide (TPR) repeat protein